MRYIVFTALLLLAAESSLADTRYVSDHLVITLRTGQGNQYKVLQALHSGARVQVLEEDGEFVRVRTRDGVEGWARGQYLVRQPVAKDRLAAAQKQLARLEQETQSLRDSVASLEAERDDVGERLERTEAERSALQERLAEVKRAAAEPLRLEKENTAMKERIGTLESELAGIERTNDRLRDKSQREWFITGAGVLGSGIFLGLVLPLMRRKRRSSGFELR